MGCDLLSRSRRIGTQQHEHSYSTCRMLVSYLNMSYVRTGIGFAMRHSEAKSTLNFFRRGEPPVLVQPFAPQ